MPKPALFRRLTHERGCECDTCEGVRWENELTRQSLGWWYTTRQRRRPIIPRW